MFKDREKKYFDIEDEYFIRFVEFNDTESFGKLYRLIEPWLFNMIFRIVIDKNIAEDVINQSWLRVIEKKDSFNPQKGKFVNFIYTIAKNFALQWKERKNLERRSMDKLRDNYNDISFPLELYETGDMIRKSIMKLRNKNHQDAIIYFYYADLEISEIAHRMNTKEHNVKNWLKRAKVKIEEDLRNQAGSY
jgi:RNA polymerase sigma factor (sigma-70 family)